MAGKYANMLVEWREKHIPLNTIDDLATKQSLEAILSAHDLLWSLQVFVIPSAIENQRTVQNLRRCCQWKFSPVNTTDRESRFSDAIRAIINDKVSSSGSAHSASAQKVEQAVERVLARARDASTNKTTMVDIDQAIKETLD